MFLYDVYFSNDYVDWVHLHACFALSRVNSTDIGTKHLWFYEAKSGLEIKHQEEFMKQVARKQNPNPETNSDGSSVGSEASFMPTNPPSCKCVTQFGYAICITHAFSVSRVNKMELFEQVRERIGSQNMLANCFDALPASKKR